MIDSKPHIETTSTKKVLIKTIETRDGQVESTSSAFSINEVIFWRPFDLRLRTHYIFSVLYILVQVINETTQNHDDME